MRETVHYANTSNNGAVSVRLGTDRNAHDVRAYHGGMGADMVDWSKVRLWRTTGRFVNVPHVPLVYVSEPAQREAEVRALTHGTRRPWWPTYVERHAAYAEAIARIMGWERADVRGGRCVEMETMPALTDAEIWSIVDKTKWEALDPEHRAQVLQVLDPNTEED